MVMGLSSAQVIRAYVVHAQDAYVLNVQTAIVETKTVDCSV